MKKLFTVLVLYNIMYIQYAPAAPNCCPPCSLEIGATNNYDSSCTNSNICNCRSTSTTNSTSHVITTTNKFFSTKCIGNTAYASCTSSLPTYSCEQGYYGRPTSSLSGCTRCPSSGGVYGTTASSGATDITECYIPSGTSGSDSSGSFTYTGNCYYTK